MAMSDELNVSPVRRERGLERNTVTRVWRILGFLNVRKKKLATASNEQWLFQWLSFGGLLQSKTFRPNTLYLDIYISVRGRISSPPYKYINV
jgi:hypothetical protein